MNQLLPHYSVRNLSIFTIFTCLLLASLPLAQLHAQCFDMTSLDADGTTCSIADHKYTYEEDFTAWYAWVWTHNKSEDYGTSTTKYTNKYNVSNWAASRQTIITTSMQDPQQNAINTLPPDKQSCIRLGNPRAGGVGSRPYYIDDYRYSTWHLQAEAIQFEFEVDNAILNFQYAALVDKTDHLLTGNYHGAQPRIEVFFTDQYGNELNVNSLAFSCWGDYSLGTAARRKDGWQTAYRNGYYPFYWKDWTTVSFDLSTYIGQTIQLHIENYDCLVEGDTHNFTYCDKHYSYLYFYLDCAEKKLEEECLPQQNVRLTAPDGFYYRWYVKETGQQLGTNRVLEAKADGTKTYCCECSQKEDMKGSFTLESKPKCDPEVYLSATICEGDFYDFNGQHLTESGNYIHVDHLSPTMDSTTHLALTVQKAINMPIEKHILCESDAFTWQGHGDKFKNLTEAKDYYDTVRFASGCPQFCYHLQLTKIASINTTDVISTCNYELNNGGFIWNGFVIDGPDKDGTTWTSPKKSSTGCDSVVTLKLNIEDEIYEHDTVIMEKFKAFKWRGYNIGTMPSGGEKQIKLPSEFCPQYAVLHVIIAPNYYIHVDTCRDELPFQWHGHTIRGMEDDSLRVKEIIDGKDTYYTLCLHLHDSYVHTIDTTICSGDTYYLGTEPITTSGTYTRQLQSMYGCDSIVTLNLTVQNAPKEKIERQDICFGQKYTWNEKFKDLDTTGVYRDTLRYSTGCDSIYKVLKLYVHAPQTKFITIKDTICKGDSLYFFGEYFKTEGKHDVHLETPFGCDSIIRLDLLVADSTHGSESASFCKDGYFEWVGHGDKFKHLEKADTYIDTLINRFGCDSIVTLTLTEGQYNSKNITPHICQGDYYDFYGKRLSTTTIGLKDTVPGTEGCDTIVTLNLTVDVPTTYEYSHSIWEGQKYRFLDTVLTTEGTFIRDTINAAHCDSTVTLHLKVLHTSTTFETIDTCDTELPFVWHNKTINDEMDSGMKDTIHTALGDSIVTLILNVHPSFSDVKIDSTILASQIPFLWQDTTFNKSGIATRTLSTIYGCDSVVTFSLHVLFTDSIFQQDTVCANQLPYIWTSPVKTHTLTDGGIYRDTLRTPMGMDSIYYIFHLIMKDDLAGTIMIDTACANDDALHIRYQWTNGEPLGYQILFSDNAKAQGFRDTIGTVDATSYSMPVSLPIPHNIADTTRYPRPDTYSLTMRVDGVCGNTVDFPVSFTILYPSWLLLQRWNDMIMLLNEDYNGGYTFSNIRWFHNGYDMDEQTRGDAHSYVYVYPNRLDMGSDDYYWAELTRTDDGKTICTCKLQAVPMSDDLTFTQDQNAPSIRLSHSTIDANHRDITITSNISGMYRLYSANGMYLQEGLFGTAYNSPTITIEEGLPTGAYILLFQGDEGTTKSEKLLIK